MSATALKWALWTSLLAALIAYHWYFTAPLVMRDLRYAADYHRGVNP